MKNLILVALILQLVIIIISAKSAPAQKKYKFGDILVFPRKCKKDGGKPRYSHYAVYVGPQSGVNVGQGENDLVHRIRTKTASCRFGRLADVKDEFEEQVYNFLDDIQKNDQEKFTAGTTEEIKARIPQLLEECKKYNLLCNNCEHFATKVRYDVSISLQIDTKAGFWMKLKPGAKKLVEKIKEDMEDEVKCVQVS